MSKTVEKRIGELFEPINGNSKYTKAYCQNNPGEYIVYTGTTIGVFGKINNSLSEINIGEKKLYTFKDNYA